MRDFDFAPGVVAVSSRQWGAGAAGAADVLSLLLPMPQTNVSEIYESFQKEAVERNIGAEEHWTVQEAVGEI